MEKKDMRNNEYLGPVLWISAMAGMASVLPAFADEEACPNRVNNTFDKLLECVTVDGVRAHQAAFQDIADANGGIRETGTPGYDASVAYVADTLETAGYDVQLNPFEFVYVPPAVLEQTAPIGADYETGSFGGSGSGTVAGPVIAVDLALGNADWPADPATSTSGCEASDFAGLDFSGPSDIALIQRGFCFFSVKAVNAEAAGAEAVVIFNQGNTPEREGLIVGTAATLPDGTPSNLTIPVVGASFFDGIALSQTGSEALVIVDPNEDRTGYNVIADLPGKESGRVVMAGAHLDSVRAGPGIQDNGAASAAMLETAVQMAKVKPRNTVRFAWWGAEELGLVGSSAYVNALSEEEAAEIALYLNFDIIASPNYVFFILDGDNSDGTSIPAPGGSDQIEYLFEHYYTQAGVPFKGTPIDDTSDYFPFLNRGIAVGGIFSGSLGIKTDEEVALWGGIAGEPYDPCFHLACDTYDNISLEALDINSDAVAYSILQLGMNTEAVNGEKGKGNFKPDNSGPPAE
jgi:Zn-dependent M28 family amino/carboxypeptidase